MAGSWIELVDATRKINGKPLGSDVSLIMNDILDDDQVMYIHKNIKEYNELDKGVAKTIKTFAANSVIWGIYINVKTGFTDTGAELLDVGVTSNGTYFESGIDIGSTGKKEVNDAEYPYFVSAEESITITYNCGNDDADAGSLELFVRYSIH